MSEDSIWHFMYYVAVGADQLAEFKGLDDDFFFLSEADLDGHFALQDFDSIFKREFESGNGVVEMMDTPRRPNSMPVEIGSDSARSATRQERSTWGPEIAVKATQ